VPVVRSVLIWMTKSYLGAREVNFAARERKEGRNCKLGDEQFTGVHVECTFSISPFFKKRSNLKTSLFC